MLLDASKSLFLNYSTCSLIYHALPLDVAESINKTLNTEEKFPH